uniref:Uncharacterized protein n=1 Tax=Setaria digitata TaxID=48799 RepID=A0A915Q3L9_9BILA
MRGRTEVTKEGNLMTDVECPFARIDDELECDNQSQIIDNAQINEQQKRLQKKLHEKSITENCKYAVR